MGLFSVGRWSEDVCGTVRMVSLCFKDWYETIISLYGFGITGCAVSCDSCCDRVALSAYLNAAASA